MILTEQQKQDVRDWTAAGATLAEIQTRLREEHEVALTYMDVRLLVLELGAEVQDKPEPKVKEPAVGDTAHADGALPEADAELPATGGIAVSLDRVIQAGALASGSVTFSDGVTARWVFDQMGRLGLTSTSQPGYRPTQEDLQAFQLELQRQLTSHGY
jgi:hypothetical protein